MNLRKKTAHRSAAQMNEMTESLENIGAGKRSRTPDLRITNALLYQLSYSGNVWFFSLAAYSGAQYKKRPHCGQSLICLCLDPASRHQRCVRSLILITTSISSTSVPSGGRGRSRTRTASMSVISPLSRL